jgi:hypothetical protein
VKTTRPDYQDVQALLDKLEDDEPVLIIIGRDACFDAAAQAWINKALAIGASDAIIERMTQLKRNAITWQVSNYSKVPDIPMEAMTEEEQIEFKRRQALSRRPSTFSQIWQKLQLLVVPSVKTPAEKQANYVQSRYNWRDEQGIPHSAGRSTLPKSSSPSGNQRS